MRLKNTIRNLITAWIGQGLLLLVKFVTRMIFARYLDAVYLGVDGIFTNIISVLSLAELGIGGAINFALYQPLAEQDISKLKSLMKFYKKIYQTIGICIGIIGLGITPFLNYLADDLPTVKFLKPLFLLYVLNTVLSYFCSYRTTLINADQKKYVYLGNHYIFYIAMNIAQIGILYFTQNFYLFIIVQICFTIGENLNIARIVGKKYEFLKDKNVQDLEKAQQQAIWNNTKLLSMGKIGNTIIDTSDTLILSKMFGAFSVGIYSNYLLVISSLTAILIQVMDSMLPSIGNLYVQEDKEKTVQIFYVSNFINSWIYVFASICLFNLLQPFIYMWLGGNYLMDFSITIMLVLRFFIKGMRSSVNVYRTALGLFQADRWKNIAEGILNLILSIFLASKIGIIGIFIGTIISAVAVGIWPEVRELYKDGFQQPQQNYYLRYMAYCAVGLVSGIITMLLCQWVDGSAIVKIVGRLFICIIVPNAIWIAVWFRTDSFQFLWNLLKSLLKRVKEA